MDTYKKDYLVEISFEGIFNIDNIINVCIVNNARYYLFQDNSKTNNKPISSLKIKTDEEKVIQNIVKYINEVQLDCKMKISSAPKYWIVIRNDKHAEWGTFIESIRRLSRNSITSKWNYYGYIGRTNLNGYFWSDCIDSYKTIPIITIDEWYKNRFIH